MQVIEQCRCLSRYFKYTDEQLRSVNYTICGNQTSAGSSGSATEELKGFRDLECSNTVYYDEELCDNQCPPACNEYSYDTRVSTSGLWPSISYQLAFYSAYIDGQEFTNKFSAYKTILDALNEGNITEVSK